MTEFHLMTKYSLTPEEYKQILISQNYCCAICDTHQEKLKRRLSVDHCHQTGNIRGLLCTSCNTGIGKLSDSVEKLQRAINYLSKKTLGST